MVDPTELCAKCRRESKRSARAISIPTRLHGHAGLISFGSVTLAYIVAAAFAAALIGSEAAVVLIIAPGLISFISGIAAASKDFKEGSYLAFALDIVGIVGGVFSVEIWAMARDLEKVAGGVVTEGAETIRELKEVVKQGAYANNAARGMDYSSELLSVESALTGGGAVASGLGSTGC